MSEITRAVEQSAEIGELAAALATVQGALKSAARDAQGQVGNTPTKYATLESVWQAVQPELSRAGLAVIQAGEEINGSPYLATTLAHSSGQWIRGRLPIIVDQDHRGTGAQAFGSAVTYLRRYALAAMIGVVVEDDDGSRAGAKSRADAKPRARQEDGQEPDAGLFFSTAKKPAAAALARIKKLGFRWSGEPDYHWSGPDTPEAREMVKQLKAAGVVERYWLPKPAESKAAPKSEPEPDLATMSKPKLIGLIATLEASTPPEKVAEVQEVIGLGDLSKASQPMLVAYASALQDGRDDDLAL